MKSQSKRKFTRHEREFRVQVATGGRVYRTTSKDLSLGGIKITDCPALERGKPVKLFVTIQEHLYASLKLLLLTAVPVWQKDNTIGLKFYNIPRDVRESLAEVTSPADYLSATA